MKSIPSFSLLALIKAKTTYAGFIATKPISTSNILTTFPTTARATTIEREEYSALEGDEYSRCLTPQQEYNQINKDLGLRESRVKRWVKRFAKIVRGKGRRRTKPGALVLIRCGESVYSKNHTFTGWLDPDLTSQGCLRVSNERSMFCVQEQTVTYEISQL